MSVEGEPQPPPSGAPAEGEAKGAKDEAKHLNLKVKSGDGSEVFFKVKATTQLGKVMAAFCKKVGQEKDNVRFLFDGERLRAEQTPAELGMEDEDEIDAMVEQTGGRSL